MNKPAHVIANTTVQLYALLFLLLGGGIGAALGYQVGALGEHGSMDMTITPPTNAVDKQFNWLLFEIGLAAGLISCAVLLAASFRTPTSPTSTSLQ